WATQAVEPRRSRPRTGARSPDGPHSDPAHAGRPPRARPPGLGRRAQEVAVSDRIFGARRPTGRSMRRTGSSLTSRFIHPTERMMTSRQLRQDIVSLAGLIGRPVLNQAVDEVGHVVDLVAKVHGGETYPLVTGTVVRVGRRRAFLDASNIDRVHRRSVTLRTARLDLREFE